MPCPNCRKESYCGCRSCLSNRKPDEVLEIWLDKEIGIVACGHCGFAMISDAWASMECDLYLEPEMSLEDAIQKYRPQGKMPNEKDYKPSLRVHWEVKLWRWRGIFKHIFELLTGKGIVYKDTKWKTITHHLGKL